MYWTNKAAQITERAPKPDAISVPVLPILDLLPATVSLALFENESSGPSGLVTTSNNGRISTASGLAISCSLPGCERLRGGGGGLNAKGIGRCLEIWMEYGTCGTEHLGAWGSGWEAESYILEGGSWGYREMELVEV